MEKTKDMKSQIPIKPMWTDDMGDYINASHRNSKI